MKKSLLATTVLAVALLGSSSAFAADSTNHGKLSAFENIKTSAISTEEANEVSGEVLWVPVAIWAARWITVRVVANAAANRLTCGTWSTCRAY